MAHQDDGTRHVDQSDSQLRSLISLFNWLVGEVVTARIMILRLAADLVRLGILPVEEINGVPLTQEIIDSVMSNFPTDPVWQGLRQRLGNSLEALRLMDLQGTLYDDEEVVDDDDLAELLADSEDAEAEPGPPPAAQVIYQDPDHDAPIAHTTLRPRRIPGGHN